MKKILSGESLFPNVVRLDFSSTLAASTARTPYTNRTEGDYGVEVRRHLCRRTKSTYRRATILLSAVGCFMAIGGKNMGTRKAKGEPRRTGAPQEGRPATVSAPSHPKTAHNRYKPDTGFSPGTLTGT